MQLSAPQPEPRQPATTDRPKARIAATLAAATASLLGTLGPTAPLQAQQPAGKGWNFDIALHSYQESNRVSDYSGTFLARRGTEGGREFRLVFTIDTLTGASASGAVPAGRAQTFTSPSGKAYYSTAAGETPLDPTFLDTRVALAGNVTQPLGRLARIDLGFSVSNEWDYLHTGVNGTYTRDFNERRTTLALGAAFARDTIEPEGGRPLPLAAMLPIGETGNKLGGSDDKTVGDFLIGVTRVLGRNTLGQITTWVRWEDAALVIGWTTALALVLALVPTLVMTRKYLDV